MMMVSNDDERIKETNAEIELGMIPIASELINNSSSQPKQSNPESWRCQLLDFFRGCYNKLKFSSPFTISHVKRDAILLEDPSVEVEQHLRFRFISKTNWASVANICKEWIKHPMNIAFLIWLTCVAVSASMLGLLLLGLLDEDFPTKSSRNHWIEINNQVLNALFTLMSIYQHPNLFHHLVLLCRWRPEDVAELGKIYCKNGGHNASDRAHIMVVLVLLHITCFAQYALCDLYWGYSRALRPEFAENLFVVIGTAAPVFAGAYALYSPLGRERHSGSDEELQVSKNELNRGVAVSKPEWVGGLFDCRDDPTVGSLSFFCTFCLFGWNMERMGFGNMYVHIVTFLLLCIAPFLIFNISALRIHDEVIGDMVGFAGILLCVFGLLYGGFWRIQMRKRFNLPGNTSCCGSAALTDYALWVFCWPCSLAQEVRTGNFYDVEDGRLYRKCMDGDVDIHPFLRPVPREGGSSPLIGSELRKFSMGGECSTRGDQFHPVQEQSSRVALEGLLAAPIQPMLHYGSGSCDGDMQH